MNERYPSEDILKILEKTIQPRDQVLASIDDNEGDELRRSIIQEIKKHSSLSPKEEKRLIQKAKTGNEAACKRIQESYTWLILTTCKEYDIYADYVQYLPDFDFFTLSMAGLRGIKMAIPMYEERKGQVFSVIAAWNIHKIILESFRQRITENYIIPEEADSMHHIWETYQSLSEQGEPTYPEVKRKVAGEIEKVRKYLDPNSNLSRDPFSDLFIEEGLLEKV